MIDGNPELKAGSQPASPDAGPVDFAYLDAQTLNDTGLERELLELFVAQLRRLIPPLPELPTERQSDTAHLLKGSARGIGAWAAAEAAEAYEAASPEARRDALRALRDAFAAAEQAIVARLAGKAAQA